MHIPLSEPGVFRQAFPLHYSEVDATGHLRLTSLLNFLQIQAGEHTQSCGFDYLEHLKNDTFWVLSRLTAVFDQWPTWPGEPLVVDTWSRGAKSLFGLRDFRFGAMNSGWAGRASSAWVMLKNRRPQKPDPWIAICPQAQPEPPVAIVPEALPEFDTGIDRENLADTQVRNTSERKANWEDVDRNGHVNNVNAIGWCLCQHDSAFLTHWRPARLEAQFLAEMFCSDNVLISHIERQPVDGQRVFDYLVVKEADQVSTLRLRLTFRSW